MKQSDDHFEKLINPNDKIFIRYKGDNKLYQRMKACSLARIYWLRRGIKKQFRTELKESGFYLKVWDGEYLKPKADVTIENYQYGSRIKTKNTFFKPNKYYYIHEKENKIIIRPIPIKVMYVSLKVYYDKSHQTNVISTRANLKPGVYKARVSNGNNLILTLK